MTAIPSLTTTAPQGAHRDFRFVPHHKPRTLVVLGLVVILPLMFSVVRYIPGFSWTIELGIALSLLLALFSIVVNKTRSLAPLDIYIIILAFGIPIIGSLGSYIAFDQPLLFGLAAQRGCLLALFSYAMSNFLADGRITTSEFQRAFIILAWINLIICSLVVMLIDPNEYRPLRGVITDGGGIYNSFILPITFIVFGALYFFSKWILTGRAFYGIQATLFFLFIVAGHGGRSAILAVLIAVAVITWIASPNRRFGNVLGAILLVAVILVVVEAALPGRMDAFYSSFRDAFSVVLGAYNVDDVSANVRIIEAEIAWPYVLEHPVIGTGTISNQWNGGYASMFGYFHPADLGLLGLTFTYGLIGVIFFGIQYVFLQRSLFYVSRILGRAPNNAFLLAVAALLTYLLVSAATTGLFILNPEQTILLFVLMRAQIQRYFSAK